MPKISCSVTCMAHLAMILSVQEPLCSTMEFWILWGYRDTEFNVLGMGELPSVVVQKHCRLLDVIVHAAVCIVECNTEFIIPLGGTGIPEFVACHLFQLKILQCGSHALSISLCTDWNSTCAIREFCEFSNHAVLIPVVVPCTPATMNS